MEARLSKSKCDKRADKRADCSESEKSAEQQILPNRQVGCEESTLETPRNPKKEP